MWCKSLNKEFYNGTLYKSHCSFGSPTNYSCSHVYSDNKQQIAVITVNTVYSGNYAHVQ